MIDADTETVAGRLRQLELALAAASEPARQREEPILNLVPKRHVETWVLCLNSQNVDETTEYRHDPRVSAETIKQAAKALLRWIGPNAAIPQNCVESLREGLPEFDRIPTDV